MAMSQVQPQEEKQKTSALENAAKVMGILSSIGGVAAQGYSALHPAAAASPTVIMAKPSDPFYLDFVSGVKK